MRHVVLLTTAGLVLALAGCSKTDPDKRSAGSWKTEAVIEKLEITGLPPAAKPQVDAMTGSMKQQLAAQFAREECLTAEAAAKENISKDFLKGLSSGGQCTMSKEQVDGGSFDLAGTCKIGPSTMEVAMNGSQGPEKAEATVTMTGGVPGAPGNTALDMKMKVTTTRTGECKA